MTNKGRAFDLHKILFLNLRCFFLKSLRKSEKLKFPSSIGDYKFNSYIKKFGLRKSYNLAIYKNKRGQKAVAKMTDAKAKGYHYYSLLNEVEIYETLNNIMQRVGNSMPEKFKDLYIPLLLRKIETDKILLVLFEYIDGELAEKLPSKEKISIYLKMVDFFTFLGDRLTKEEKKRISKRTSVDYIYLYPLLLVKAIITYPKALPYLVKGALIFWLNIPTLLKGSKTALVHRDLHFMNIILSKSRTTLIDLQHCVFTEPIHEFATTLRYLWKEDDFYTLFLPEIQRRFAHRKNFNTLFRLYIINSATHGLTGRGFPDSVTDNWIDCLKFAVNLNNKKYPFFWTRPSLQRL